MGDILFYVGIAACLVTLGILIYGIRGFGTGTMTPSNQNKMMRWRIIAQFAAVMILLVAFLLSKDS
jgi:hypothetical protein